MFLTFLYFLIGAPIATYIIVLIPFQIIKIFKRPKLNRDWLGLNKRLSEIKTVGSDILVSNVRNFTYNPIYEYEYKSEWLNKKYNLNDLKRVWLVVNPFYIFQTHIILSLEFSHDIFLTVSYELRKAEAKDFKFSDLLWRKFESYYLLATEQDTVFIRTNIRNINQNNSVYLLPIKATEDQLKNIFLSLTGDINLYSGKPFFYNFYSRNCLTEILKHFKKANILSYRNSFQLLNIMKFIYKSNLVEGSEKLTYKKFKEKYKISDKTKNLKQDENFSYKIREGIFTVN